MAESLPHNSSAERAVLGSIMLKSEAVVQVLSSLEEDDFFEGRHKIIYRAILNLYNKKTAIDTLTLTQELMSVNELENVGGVIYLQECADSMVALANLEFYINIVNDNSVLRKMLSSIRKIDEEYLKNGTENINDFIINSELSFKNSIARRKVSNFKTSSEVATIVKEDIDRLAEARELKNTDEIDLLGLTTGFPKLNKLIMGFQKEQLIIVAGRPGLGKTALALNFAYKAARYHNVPIAIFSLEMSADLLVRRLVASSACVDLQKIATGNLTPSEKNKVASAIREVASTPIFIDDSPGLKLLDIVSKAKKLQATNPDLGMVIIDYIGLIQLGGKSKGSDNRQEEVRQISLALKDLSRELKVPVIALSQLSRDVEKRDSKKPMLSDLRDSGSIEQDADIVMLLYREDYYDKDKKKTSPAANKSGAQLSDSEKSEMYKATSTAQLLSSMPGNASYVECNVAKNRNGQVGKAGLFFYKSYGRFDPTTQEWDEQMRAIEANGGAD